MFKIYNFSQEKNLEKVNDVEISKNFEIVPPGELSPQEILQQRFDVIEMAGRDFEEFRPFVKAIDWRTNLIGVADCLIWRENSYKPHNLLAEVLMSIVKKNPAKVNSQLPLLIIGDYHFVISVAAKFILNGFIELVIAVTDENGDFLAAEIEKKLRGFAFNLNITVVNINELTTIDRAGFLLISDFKKEVNREAYELLTYFNFLSEGALFIDCNSIRDQFLVDDARKAEIAVIDEGEVINAKYLYLLNLLKNSSKV